MTEVADKRGEVIGIAVDVVGVRAGWVVALAVPAMVEQDAAVCLCQRLQVAGGTPETRVAAGPEVQNQGWPLSFYLIVKANPIRRRERRHERILARTVSGQELFAGTSPERSTDASASDFSSTWLRLSMSLPPISLTSLSFI